MKTLTFDIMVGDRFYKTMRLRIGLDCIVGYDGDKPIINFEKIEEWVLKNAQHLNTKIGEFVFKQEEQRSVHTLHRDDETSN